MLYSYIFVFNMAVNRKSFCVQQNVWGKNKVSSVCDVMHVYVSGHFDKFELSMSPRGQGHIMH